MSSRHAVGLILVGQPPLERFVTVPKLSLWVLESQSLKNGFVPLSGLIHVSDFVSQLFL